MKAIFEDAIYADLQLEIHDALLAQHPDWILPNGDSPTCDFYDARFAELLIQSVPGRRYGLKQSDTHQFQPEFQYPTRVGTTHTHYEEDEDNYCRRRIRRALRGKISGQTSGAASRHRSDADRAGEFHSLYADVA